MVQQQNSRVTGARFAKPVDSSTANSIEEAAAAWIPFESVEPVMEALARAGGLAGRPDGVRVNLVIQIEKGGDA